MAMPPSDVATRPAPASEEEGVDDDDFIPGSPVAAPAAPAAPARKRRRLDAPQREEFIAFLVADPRLPNPAWADVSSRLLEIAAPQVVGVARCEWCFHEANEEGARTHDQFLPAGPRRRFRGKPPWGYCEYWARDVWLPDGEGIAVPDGMDIASSDAQMRLFDLCANARLARYYPNVRAAAVTLGPPSQTFALPLALADVCSDTPFLLRSVALHLRTTEGLCLGAPLPRVVDRWRKDCDALRKSQVPAMEPGTSDRWSDIACELPADSSAHAAEDDEALEGRLAVEAKTVDPMLLLKGLRFSHLLRDQKNFQEGLDAAHDFNAPSEDEGKRDRTHDIPTTNLHRAAGRLDVVGMLIQRREMKADRLCDRILGFNLFSDASPVTGEEFQGMILETITRLHECRRETLPGSTLSYGRCNAVCKGIAMLFGLWLVAGPFFCDLAWVLAHVLCITTDFGIEIKCVELPDVLRAFLRWNAGALLLDCGRLVDHSRRLYIRALRISGWSHLFGNLMSHIAKCSPQWAGILEDLRTMVTVMKNGSNRKHILFCLRGKGLDLTPLKKKLYGYVH